MSECVVRMEMPERCYECDMADGVTCMATGGVYGREVPKMTWIRRRPDWCPIICSLPEGHGRLVDMKDIDLMMENASSTSDESGLYSLVYRDDLDFDGLPTIVPAEMSE